MKQVRFSIAPPPAPHPAEWPPLDQSGFQRLLALAGPADQHELIRRLTTDLQSVEHGLASGFAGPDWAELRAQSHVLKALAGTLGAQALHNAAERLNRQARRRDPQGLELLQQEMLPLFDTLIACIAQMRACLMDRP